MLETKTRKKWMLRVPSGERRTSCVTKGEEHIFCYTYNTHQAKHYFCKTCGIHSHYQPRFDPNGRGVSLRCLDEGTVQKVITCPAPDCRDWKNWEKYVQEHPEAKTLTENVE